MTATAMTAAMTAIGFHGIPPTSVVGGVGGTLRGPRGRAAGAVATRSSWVACRSACRRAGQTRVASVMSGSVRAAGHAAAASASG